jgi:nucleoside-diphosphate-sugar epimerase
MRAERFDAAIDMIGFTKDDALSSIRAFAGVRHFVQCSTVCTYGVQYDWLPVTEDHPLRPITDYGRNKAAADAAYLEAWYRDGFPVTIIKPSTTYGPRLGALRQIAWDFSWIDRVRKGKPILVCGDGSAIHQFLHVDDAALCFANVLGKTPCIGQIYNMVNRGFIRWADYHRVGMKVLGREVELVGVPLADLLALGVPAVGICRDIFAHNVYYSAEKLFRDVPEFQPKISLAEGLRQVIEALDREGRVPDSDRMEWEDRIIAAQRKVRATGAAGNP